MAKLSLTALILAVVALVGGVFSGVRFAEAELSAKVKTIADYMKEKGISPDEKFLIEKLPKAEVVGPLEFDFGHLGHKESKQIEFKIKNSGGSDLRIDPGDVSCQMCVAIEIPVKDLPSGVQHTKSAERPGLIVSPGATASVFVHFSQKEKAYEPEVSQTAKFRTNDPLNSVIEFRIAGKITKAYRLLADSIPLSDVTIGSGIESRLGLFGYGEPLKIEKLEFLTEVRDDQFTAKIEPMPEEAVKAEAGATSGFNIVFTAHQPPMGKIDHRLKLTISNAEPHTVEIPVTGNVVSKIQVIQASPNPRARWIANATYLDWGVIEGKVGDEVTLHIRSKVKAGDPEVEFKVKEVFPNDVLQVELGETRRTETVQIVPITIRIPAGAKPANYRSLLADNKPPRIIIGTSDATTREIVIGLRFGIE